MENGDAGVRLEAVSLIPLTRLEQYQTILFLALNDLTKSVRSKAIHLLAPVNDAQRQSPHHQAD